MRNKTPPRSSQVTVSTTVPTDGHIKCDDIADKSFYLTTPSLSIKQIPGPNQDRDGQIDHNRRLSRADEAFAMMHRAVSSVSLGAPKSIAWDVEKEIGPFYGLPWDTLSDLTGQLLFLIGGVLLVTPSIVLQTLSGVVYLIGSIVFVVTYVFRIYRASKARTWLTVLVWILGILGAGGFALFCLLSLIDPNRFFMICNIGFVVSCVFFLMATITGSIIFLKIDIVDATLPIVSVLLDISGCSLFVLGSFDMWQALILEPIDEGRYFSGRMEYLVGSVAQNIACWINTFLLLRASRAYDRALTLCSLQSSVNPGDKDSLSSDEIWNRSAHREPIQS